MFLCNVLCSEKGFCFQTGCSAKSKSKTCPSVTIRRLWRVTTNINSQMESSAKLHPSIDNSLHEAPTGEGLLQWGLSAEKSHILQSCSSFVHLLFIFVQPFNRPRPSIIYIWSQNATTHVTTALCVLFGNVIPTNTQIHLSFTSLPASSGSSSPIHQHLAHLYQVKMRVVRSGHIVLESSSERQEPRSLPCKQWVWVI